MNSRVKGFLQTYTKHNSRTFFGTTKAHYISKLLDKYSYYETVGGDTQRKVDENHLTDLINYQIKHFSKYNEFSFPNNFVICRLDNKFILVDGQHRLLAIDYFFNNKKYSKFIKKCMCSITMITIEKEEEYDDIFLEINKNKPVQLYKNIIDWKEVIKKYSIYFESRFKKYLKTSNNPRVPNMNLDKLTLYIDESNMISRCKCNFETLKNETEKLNEFYKNHWITSIKKKNYIRNVDTYISRCKDKQPHDPCYLGLYTQFEWLERIMNKLINNVNYENMEHMRNGYRISIPKPLRKMVWRKRHKNTLRGTCDCCNDPIDYDTFEVGHDIAVANGGTNEIGNLYAICSSCNKDMGTMNYRDYRRNIKTEY